MTAIAARLPRIIRFGLAGIAGLCIDFALLIALVSAGVPLPVASGAAFLLQGAAHYTITRLWVFPHDADGGEFGKAARYFTLLGVNAAVTAVAVPALAWSGLDYRVAKGGVVVVLFFANYVLVPRVVMRLR